MFEAHTLTTIDTELQPVCNTHWQHTYCRRHLESLRPLKIWLAKGKRKDLEQRPLDIWFIYIEYRDNRGSNRFYCLERRQQGQTLDQLVKEAVSTPIPDIETVI